MSWKKRNRRTDKGTDNALVTGQSSHEKNQQIKNLDFRPLTSKHCGKLGYLIIRKKPIYQNKIWKVKIFQEKFLSTTNLYFFF